MTRFYRRILCIFFVSFIISSCGDVKYPAWYLENDEDSAYLYGVGSGDTLDSAKSVALNDLSSQISLKIESATSIEQSQINDLQSNKADSKIDVSVLGIELNSVEYIKQEEVDGVFYVKSRIAKHKIIKQLNTDIETAKIAINTLLDDANAMKCATISPKHKVSLAKHYNILANKAMQIRALDGKVSAQKLIDDLQNLLSNNSRGYYVAFASGSSETFSRVDSGLNAEYKKFFTLEQKGDKTFMIENRYSIQKGDEVKITLEVNIKDCVGNAIFNTLIIGKASNYSGAISRIKAQLYKKLKAWQDDL
ncbi:LPP20 family lipoprotein [Helicobacter sp. 23-1045]